MRVLRHEPGWPGQRVPGTAVQCFWFHSLFFLGGMGGGTGDGLENRCSCLHMHERSTQCKHGVSVCVCVCVDHKMQN